ncbi:MAG: AmmeMemoRadiSam system protein A [Anaerolineaceae bacterium]|nr:AmmeMemoRadiSam system protein A [Anaerolineaceae bacterium]
MNPQPLSTADRDCLLQLARQTLAFGVDGKPAPAINLEEFPPHLREPGATFVTLTEDGELRGCVGALEAYQSLVEDVVEHAAAAAFHDYRFPPLQECELPLIHIEISVLSPPVLLEYTTPDDLMEKLRPGVDGVLLLDGFRRSTFLPQVWQMLPTPDRFMEHLCLKMDAPGDLWRRKHLTVYLYQVESFEEEITNPS